jgi:hypothetical protein
MNPHQDLERLLPQIEAIPLEQVRKCDIPIGIYLHEATLLHTRAILDKDRLDKANMPPELYDQLLERTNALRMAETIWHEQVSQRQQALLLWKEEKPRVLKFFKDVCRQMKFAYRNNPSLLRKVRGIEKHQSMAIIIQGLNDLSVIGKGNQEPLKTIGFELAKLNQAAHMSDATASLYAQTNMERYGADKNKMIRDKAYILLKEVVDEIRNYGRFVFRDDRLHAKAYASAFKRERLKQYRQRIAVE